MNESDIRINSYNLEDIASLVGSSEANLDDTKGQFERDFKNLGQANLFVGGLDKMDKKMARVQTKLRMINNAIRLNNEQIILLEQNLKSEIDSMEIPKGYGATDTASQVTFAALNMSKIDGRSVNEGNLNQIDETQRESVINRNENLKDITKDTNLDTKVLNNYTVEAQRLNNINNERKQEEVVYNDQSGIAGQEQLHAMDTTTDGMLHNTDVVIDVNKANLNDMSSEELKEEGV